MVQIRQLITLFYFLRGQQFFLCLNLLIRFKGVVMTWCRLFLSLFVIYQLIDVSQFFRNRMKTFRFFRPKILCWIFAWPRDKFMQVRSIIKVISSLCFILLHFTQRATTQLSTLHHHNWILIFLLHVISRNTMGCYMVNLFVQFRDGYLVHVPLLILIKLLTQQNRYDFGCTFVFNENKSNLIIIGSCLLSCNKNITSMVPQRLTKSSLFRIKTQPTSAEFLNQKSKYHRYDTALFHKTSIHLKSTKQNPQLATKTPNLSVSSKLKTLRKTPSKSMGINEKKQQKKKKQVFALLPQSISIRSELTKWAGLQRNVEKLLEEETIMLVTAKKWIIYDMETNTTIKGYKHKKQHDIASLSKVLTFYTSFMIIQRYYLSIDRFQLLVLKQDEHLPGTNIRLKSQYLITIQDLLYALMLQSANNAATVIANNLGSLIKKKRQGKYFSCFDLPNENREQNIQIFVNLMNTYAKQLGLQSASFVNPHGVQKNKSSAFQIALLTSECYKIPLFSKVVNTKYYKLKAKYITDDGQQKTKQLNLKNTNQLLWSNSGCIGGKTGCNSVGGESLVACYEGNIIIVVLGCGSKEDKFADSQKLVGWLYKVLGMI